MGGIVSLLFGNPNSGTQKVYQRIGEVDKQSSKEGEPRPVVWGRVRPISGNVIHSSSVRYEMVEESRQETGGGKGGGGGGTTIIQYREHVYRTYAIRICEGPITSVLRVWRNDKLVYDGRGTEWGTANNDEFTKNVTLYLGSFTQSPDPTLEAMWGAGNVPAYRGTAYIVVNDDDVTKWGGRIPHFVFEVERINPKRYLTSEVYTWSTITSLMYGIDPELVQATGTGGGVVEGILDRKLIYYTMEPDYATYDDSAFSLTQGVFRNVLIGYTLEPDYGMYDDSAFSLTQGVFRNVLRSYIIEPDYATYDDTAYNVTQGNLRKGLITYSFYEPEYAQYNDSQMVVGDHSTG